MTEEHSLLGSYHFWYALDAVLFVALAWYLGRKPIVGMIDAEIAKVRSELEEARQLRAEAAAALEDYRGRQKAAMEEASQIIARAKVEAARLRTSAEEELKASLERHEQKAAERIRLAEEEAVAEVRTAIIEQAVAKTRDALARRVDAAVAGRLADQAIASLPKLMAAGGKNR
ncbi:MAG: F0F1 ATP synthase subunit B [Alphaproteobacteria bacterium]|nr:F0F1 ATP synthase subunit B [Alphaproteobacteria bacterium]